MLAWRKPTQKCQVWVQSKTKQQFPAWCEKLPSRLVSLGTVSCVMASIFASAGQLELTGGAAALESHKSTAPVLHHACDLDTSMPYTSPEQRIFSCSGKALTDHIPVKSPSCLLPMKADVLDDTKNLT